MYYYYKQSNYSNYKRLSSQLISPTNNRQMGNQCSSNIKQQFQLIRQFDHISLGRIKLIRSIRPQNFNSQSHPTVSARTHSTHSLNLQSNSPIVANSMQRTFEVNGEENISIDNFVRNGDIIGIKNISFGTQLQREKYVKYVKQANIYYRIPTLLRVLGFDTNQGKTWNPHPNNTQYRCSTFYNVNLYFPYYPHTLRQLLTQKHTQITKLKLPNNSKPPIMHLRTAIKLNNYTAIDKLTHTQRNIINLYYQQIQILRLIDYIVGALYFLNHLEHKHQAVCPENIMVDQQGKFALIDAIVGLEQVNKKIGTKIVDGKGDKKHGVKRDGLRYLSPQLLCHIKSEDTSHRQSIEKAEVFSVGLIALEMCLIDYNIFEPNSHPSNIHTYKNRLSSILDRQALKLSKPNIIRSLIQVQSRYSLQLSDLLTLMLEYDPIKRINFSTLIDLLSPLLMKNLNEIQNLYGIASNLKTNNDKEVQQIYSNVGDAGQSVHNNPHNNINIHNYNNKNYHMTTSITSPKPQQCITQQKLIQKLSQLQQSYKNIMNKSVLLGYQYQYPTNPNNNTNYTMNDHAHHDKLGYIKQQIINDEKRILKQLRKINLISKNKVSFGNNSNIAHNKKNDHHSTNSKNINIKINVNNNTNTNNVSFRKIGKNNVHNTDSNTNINENINSLQSQIRCNENKRQVKGIELYDLYLNQYESIKKNRLK